jgi:predicted O-methyltransferase YrrM
MFIVNEPIQEYCEKMTSRQDEVLTDLERLTHLRTTQANMLSGNFQGQLLTMIAAMLQATNILEIGTFTGYSAICLAKGLSNGGVVHSIDPDVEKRYLVEDFVAKAGLAHKVKLYSGLAQEVILNELSDQIFDLVFIDADKENYSLYYDLVIDQIRANGIILVDNVLWKGRVLEEKKDKKTAIIDAFNQKVKEDPRVSKILLPIRDGLFLIQKNG